MSSVIVSRHPATVEFIAKQLGATAIFGRDKTNRAAVCMTNKDGRLMPHMVPTSTIVSVAKMVSVGPGRQESEWIIPVITGNATSADVEGKTVYGNIPLHLAAMANEVVALEFDGPPPRGAEYALEDMVVAGAKLNSYVVKRTAWYEKRVHLTREEANLGGYAC